LIEVTIVAALELLGHIVVDKVASLVPESWELACLVVFVARLEVEVLSRTLPQDPVLGRVVWRGLVEVTFEADKVSHTARCVSEGLSSMGE
jgi:hypothetical protein